MLSYGRKEFGESEFFMEIAYLVTGLESEIN